MPSWFSGGMKPELFHCFFLRIVGAISVFRREMHDDEMLDFRLPCDPAGDFRSKVKTVESPFTILIHKICFAVERVDAADKPDNLPDVLIIG